MSWEKSIADRLTGFFSKAKSVETAVVNEVKKVEGFVLGEVNTAFDKTRQAALAANDEVNKLKADLQTALAKAANLHQAAVDAANAARAAAEADVAKFAAAASAHSADLATQSSTQTITPAAPAPAPVADAPAADASTPASITPTQQ